jgi:hypothetical protein
MRTKPMTTRAQPSTDLGVDTTWIEAEVSDRHFIDVRLAKRLRKLLGQLSGGGVGESVPYACQDWANTKAAYRFFDN